MTSTSFLSGKQLAALLSVSESTLSEGAANETPVRGYPVADWADRSDSGRSQGYRVPNEIADWLVETMERAEARQPTEATPPPALFAPPAPLPPAPPPPAPVIHVAAPEPDKTFDRLRDGYDHMLGRHERLVEQLQAENARFREDAFRTRDEMRAQATEASERLNSLRLTHMEEINTLRFQAMEAKTELRIAEEGLSDDRSTVERLMETHGDSFFGTLQLLAATLGNAVSAAKGDATTIPVLGALPAPPPAEEDADGYDLPEYITALTSEMHGALTGGDSVEFGRLVTVCQSDVPREEWDIVGIDLLNRLAEDDPTAIAAVLRPVVAERAAVLLTLPPAMALPMLSGFGIDLSDEATEWVAACLSEMQRRPPMESSRQRKPRQSRSSAGASST